MLATRPAVAGRLTPYGPPIWLCTPGRWTASAPHPTLLRVRTQTSRWSVDRGLLGQFSIPECDLPNCPPPVCRRGGSWPLSRTLF